MRRLLGQTPPDRSGPGNEDGVEKGGVFDSENWAGKPLRSLEVMLGYIRGTRTETGWTVTAHLDEDFCRKSVPYSPNDGDQLGLKSRDVCPQWNYTISPQSHPPPAPQSESECSQNTTPAIQTRNMT